MDSQSHQAVKSSKNIVQRDVVSNNETYYRYKLISDEQLKHVQSSPPASKIPEVFTELKLNFTVSTKHLRARDGQLGLKCSASVLDLYWRSGEVTTQVVARSRWYPGQFSSSQDKVGLTNCAFIFSIFANILTK